MPSSETTTSTLLSSPLPTPHWGSRSLKGPGAFTIRALTPRIRAPASQVLETLLNTSQYGEWNGFVPRVKIKAGKEGGRLEEGVTFTEHVDLFGHGKPSGVVKMKLLMTTLSLDHAPNSDSHHSESGKGEGNDDKKRYKVVWLGKGYPKWALRSERVHIVEEIGDGETRYEVFETFSGPLAGVVRVLLGAVLRRRFGQWNREVGGWCEGRGGRGDVGSV